MCEILPFRGYRYNVDSLGSVDGLLAPPYDCVTEVEAREVVEKNPYNIFALEMASALNGASKNVLSQARERLFTWIREGVLIRDQEPCVYPYEIEFQALGRRYTRTGLITLVRLESWESGKIIPHERTFKKVTEDRLRLLKDVGAQFSQVFLLSKGCEEVSDIASLGKRQFLFEAKDRDGNRHRLFKLNDKEGLRHLGDAVKGQKLYIADGHHRYTTCLNFKEWCEREGCFKGVTPLPHHYFLAYIVDSKDPGLMTLPTHRVVKKGGDLGIDPVGPLREFFDVREVGEVRSWEALEDTLSTLGDSPGFLLVLGGIKKVFCLSIASGGKKALSRSGIETPLLDLDVTCVDYLAIPKLFKEEPSCLKEEGLLHYKADGKEILEDLEEDEVVFYLRPTGVDALFNVADSGCTMPHKATFFYPKILTGTVVRLLGKE